MTRGRAERSGRRWTQSRSRRHQTPAVLFLQSQEFFGADSAMHANIVRNLDRERWRVLVAVGTNPSGVPSAAENEISKIPGVTLIHTDFGPQRDNLGELKWPRRLWVFGRAIASLGRLAYLARRQGVGVVHGSEKPRDAVPTVTLARLIGARSVVHVHGKWGGWMPREARLAAARADAVIAISGFVEQSIVEAGGADPDRCHVVVNGIDPSDWEPSTPAGSIRREFGIDDDEVVIGIFSRMSVWKGHLELARALAMLPPGTQRFRVLVVGSDDVRSAPDQPPLSETLTALLDELDLMDRFVFAGWRTDIEELMAASDIYAMPAFEEGVGVVFLEAMAMETPVVALQSGGVPEVVVDEVTGLLAPVGDIEGLTERLGRLITSPGLRRSMGSAGRQHVVDRRSAEVMADETATVYDQLIGRDAVWKESPAIDGGA